MPRWHCPCRRYHWPRKGGSQCYELMKLFTIYVTPTFFPIEWQDCRMVVERYKSGFFPPEDIPFEDLSNMRSGSVGSDSSSNGGSLGSGAINSTISSSSHTGLKSETKSGTMSGIKLKKRAGLFGIFNAGKVTRSIVRYLSAILGNYPIKLPSYKWPYLSLSMNSPGSTILSVSFNQFPHILSSFFILFYFFETLPLASLPATISSSVENMFTFSNPFCKYCLYLFDSSLLIGFFFF